MNQASLEQERWIKRVWNWTGGSSESGTGQVELDRLIELAWNWTGGSRESGTGQMDQASLELDRLIE